MGRKGFGKIILDYKHIGEALRHISNKENEIRAITLLLKVLKRGIEIESHKSYKNREPDSYTFAAPVVVNGVRGNMAVVVQRTTKDFLHAYRGIISDGPCPRSQK